MSKTCSCGGSKYEIWDDTNERAWVIPISEYQGYARAYRSFCPDCGDELLPDGRIIQRETVPSRLMDMLREVQATCPESGLQEFALRVFNWIEEMREQAGLTHRELSAKAGSGIIYEGVFLNHPSYITLGTLFRLLNAAQKAQEVK